jgi:hypothetical protein
MYCSYVSQALLLNQPRVVEQADGSVVVAVHALIALPNVVRRGARQWSPHLTAKSLACLWRGP